MARVVGRTRMRSYAIKDPVRRLREIQGRYSRVFRDRHLLVQEEAVTRVRELLVLVPGYSPIFLR